MSHAQYHTTPLIPWINNNSIVDTSALFMQVDGKPYSSEAAVNFYRLPKSVIGEVGVLALNTQIPLLAVSENKELVDSGTVDSTDAVAPNIYLAALYLTKPGQPVIRAMCLVRPGNEQTLRDHRGRAFAAGYYNAKNDMVLRAALTFRVDLKDGNLALPTEFMLGVDGSVNPDTGMAFVATDSATEQELRVTKSRNPDASRKQLFGYRPAGFELTAGRINYNRVLR